MHGDELSLSLMFLVPLLYRMQGTLYGHATEPQSVEELVNTFKVLYPQQPTEGATAAATGGATQWQHSEYCLACLHGGDQLLRCGAYPLLYLYIYLYIYLSIYIYIYLYIYMYMPCSSAIASQREGSLAEWLD
jgi:hypothetical protein